MPFEELVGNPRIKKVFKNYLCNDTIPFSMIFSGPPSSLIMEFALGFAKFWRDIVQAEGAEDRRLVGALDAFVFLKKSVLVELQAHPFCPGAHLGVVFLAAREVRRGERELIVLDRPKVDVDSRLERNARFCGAARDDRGDPFERCERLHDRIGLLRAHENIDVFYRLPVPSETSRDERAFDVGVRIERFVKGRRFGERLVDPVAFAVLFYVLYLKKRGCEAQRFDTLYLIKCLLSV